ncbi:MAG: hypothetical protein IKH31_05980 [Clostridia bacterium]|nr:hypothetical protein [Clostridia bacterium]
MEKEFEILVANPNLISKGSDSVSSKKISVSTLKEGLNTFLDGISDVFSDIKELPCNYYVDELELKLDVTISGGIRLIGSAEASTAGGITLKIKQRKSHE